jgi:hypothetical protein
VKSAKIQNVLAQIIREISFLIRVPKKGWFLIFQDHITKGYKMFQTDLQFPGMCTKVFKAEMNHRRRTYIWIMEAILKVTKNGGSGLVIICK